MTCLVNRPCLGYVPDGVSVMDCLDLFVLEMKVLERGWRVWSKHHQRYVVVFGRLFMNIADFPAAQELSGSRGISALHPCRLCLALKGTYASLWTLRLNEDPIKSRDWMMDVLEKYEAEKSNKVPGAIKTVGNIWQ